METGRTAEDMFAVHRDALQIELGERVLEHIVVVKPQADPTQAAEQATE